MEIVLFKDKYQKSSNTCAHFSSTYTRIGKIQKRDPWPLHKDDTQIRELFLIFVVYIYTPQP